MKNFITGVFTLLATGFAFAQANVDVSTQMGNLNVATVNQTGFLIKTIFYKTVTVTQQTLTKLEHLTLMLLRVTVTEILLM